MHIDNSRLSDVREAILKAKNAQAEHCAPELLASAVSTLHWAAHEISEGGVHVVETQTLIEKAKLYAQQATQAANHCLPHTTVILMPDEDGKVGAVIVKTKNDSKLIDQAYHFSSVIGEKDMLSPITASNEKEVYQKYATLLKAQPLKPAHFTLLFITGTSQMIALSEKLLTQITKELSARSPATIHITGHADTVGHEQNNMTLSQKRAQQILKKIRQMNVPIQDVNLHFHGEQDLAIPTPDNTDELRNRRVELSIF